MSHRPPRPHLTKTMWGVKWRPTINWGWIKLRWAQRHCHHVWVAGETKKNPHYACAKNECSVWRWYPITWRIVGVKKGT